MLIIRNEQIERFDSVQRKRFIDLMYSHLSCSFTKQIANFEELELKNKITDVIYKGEEIGFSTEIELASFIEYVIPFKLNIKNKETEKIIYNNKLSNKEKLASLGKLTLDSL